MLNEVFDLMIELGASDEQLDFPILYASGRAGFVRTSLEDTNMDVQPLFDAIHQNDLRITNESQLTDWLGRQKVDLTKFNAALKSFSVESKLKRAAELTQASKADGVPALMVNGRYLVVASTANSEERMLTVADSLIDQARRQLAATAPKK